MTAYPEEGILTAACEPVSFYRINPDEYFISVYNELRPYAFFLAKSLVPTEDASDIVAAVFSKLWPKKNTLENIEHLKGYIGASIRNACLDHLRTESKRRKEEKIYLELSPVFCESDYSKAEISAEKLQRIYQAMEGLPMRCREIFKMAFLQNLKNSEIARRLGITSRTVINQKSNALKTLRMALLSLALQVLLSVFP
jgi:RNA polymerase sigma-70 factor (ECF subfamily)